MNIDNTQHSAKPIPSAIWHLAVGLSLLIGLQPGCYDPTSDKVDAGASTAQQEQEVTAEATDLRIPLNGDNCDIKWTGSNTLGQTPHGFFYELEGQLLVGGEDQALKHFEVLIQMDSVKAVNEALTVKLKTKGFFEVEKYPTAEFKVTEIKEPRPTDPEGSTHLLVGNLTLREITKSISFPVTFQFDAEKGIATLTSEFSINRKDFGVVYEISLEDNAIRNDVLLNLDIEAEVVK